MKYLISGGGTGGHIFPAVSIANALREADPDCEILFVGALGRMEMERVPLENTFLRAGSSSDFTCATPGF